MLLFSFLLLTLGAAEALVLSSQLEIWPNVTQSFEEDNVPNDTSLDTAAGLNNVTSEMTATSLAVFNSSLASNNVSAQVRYECQERFGSNLNLWSCQSAALSIEYQSQRPCTWGLRGTAVRYDFPLPQRWVSSDGACTIGVLLGPGATSARASLEDVAKGAFEVVQKCVEQKSPSVGGIAIELGDGRLGIFVAKQTPNVRCYGTAFVPDIVKSCQSIMDSMDVSEITRSFGIGGVGVYVELPYVWHSVDHKCIMTLRTSGPPDNESWRRIWDAATFVTAMCAKKGKKGLYTQLGTNKRLYLEVAAEGVGNVDIS